MSEIKYISTRGQAEPMGFQDAVMTGLATDGGLIVPDQIPNVAAKLTSWKGLSYAELAFEVMRLFVDVPEDDLRVLINRSYATFREVEVCPLVKVDGVHVLELFHGPTLAFKDVALQFLGNLFEYILTRTGAHLNILAATSGDTGSAAIYGVRGKQRIHIFVMHPDGRVSPTQELQMTSVMDDNVFNIAVKGTFDDCQNMMKAIFRDVDFKQQYALGAVNSVNWARVLAQIVYYFYAGLQVMESEQTDRVQFAVPTGNFGDILAGWFATQMGLPVERLILATNENDILSRFFNTGVYSMGEVVPTLSPSMDIQLASNFERYLYYRAGQDGSRVDQMMADFRRTGSLKVEKQADGCVDSLFLAGAANTENTLETIRRCYVDEGYLLDPHTATGVYVGGQLADAALPVICLATAHPAKFGKAIQDATGKDLAHHDILDALKNKETHSVTLPADESAIRAYLIEHAMM